jgi:hypothetical protein
MIKFKVSEYTEFWTPSFMDDDLVVGGGCVDPVVRAFLLIFVFNL